MNRIKKLQNIMCEQKIDLILLFSLDDKTNPNILYLTNYDGMGILSLLQKNAFLLVPEMEYDKAKKTKTKVYKAEKRLLQNLKDLLKNKRIKKIGINENALTVYHYKKLQKLLGCKFQDISEFLSELRMKKDEEEIKKIKKACKVTDAVYKKILDNFNFKTEKDLKNFIEFEIKKQDCELAFTPIVASAKNSSFPHYNKMNNKINKGFLLLDFGAKYKQYCSDMSRMLYVGTPNKEEKENFDLVLNTVKKCQEAAEKKVFFAELEEVAEKELGNMKKYFTHSLGHGLGIEIHEKPNMSKDAKTKINENIPFTIEPGVYLPKKYGIRIEDTVIIKKSKLEVLTKSKKELHIISS